MDQSAALNARARSYKPAATLLEGRVIAVTGAGDGIGRAVAIAAAAHGAEVILIGRTVSRLEAVHSSIEQTRPGAATIAALDLERALARDYDQLASAVGERYRRLDGLVHCAGLLGVLSPLEHYDVPTFYRVLHVNVTAAFALTQVLLPLLRSANEPSVVFTSSSVGRKGKAYWGAYAISKFALEGMTQVLADEAGQSNLRVNALNPGAVRTKMRRQAYPSEDANRLPAPEDVVAPYLWLLGADSLGINGQSLDCQGPVVG